MTKSNTRYYLAYGSNLNTDQMSERCPDAQVYGTAVIPNYELLFRGSRTGSYLTIDPADGGEVPVGVWSVSEADERRLDAYEGFPRFYYKAVVKNLPIQRPDGQVEHQDAFVYIMRRDRAIGLPDDWYVQVVELGYADFGFDTRFLYDAIGRSARHRLESRRA